MFLVHLRGKRMTSMACKETKSGYGLVRKRQ